VKRRCVGRPGGYQVRDGPAIDGDAEVLTSLDLPQHSTEVVAQLALGDRPHTAAP
jgi:hypothetical protein